MVKEIRMFEKIKEKVFLVFLKTKKKQLFLEENPNFENIQKLTSKGKTTNENTWYL